MAAAGRARPIRLGRWRGRGDPHRRETANHLPPQADQPATEEGWAHRGSLSEMVNGARAKRRAQRIAGKTVTDVPSTPMLIGGVAGASRLGGVKTPPTPS